MKLLTRELEKRFAEVGSQEVSRDPLVIAKFFEPTGPAMWFATEYDPTTRMFFGYATLFGLGSPEDEWGHFGLDELESIRGRFGVGIERDKFFAEKRASEVIRNGSNE
jgi:Protein of unknown function (DUF2958)